MLIANDSFEIWNFMTRNAPSRLWFSPDDADRLLGRINISGTIVADSFKFKLEKSGKIRIYNL